MDVTIYGIRNCDTMKKARAWLDTRGVAYDFHDYKTAGIDRTRLARWCNEQGWEKLLNRNGATFRNLSDAEKQVGDASTAIKLMIVQPSLIKRPVLECGGRLLVGFDPAAYQVALRSK